MTTKYIIKKQLSCIPCRFILGVIAPSRELNPEINSYFLSAVEKRFKVENLLPAQNFQNPPESYFVEMGEQPLSTAVFVLKERGGYTDLHHIKKKTVRLEEQFTNIEDKRSFNINPGAVGTYGLCLASHKSKGERHDLSTYAYSFYPHLFFGGDSFYERVMRWDNGKLELVGKSADKGKFPEYSVEDRISEFERLVRTLPKNDVSVELIADHYRIEPLFGV